MIRLDNEVYMSNDERKIRLSVARDIIDNVYKDLCNESTNIISRKMTEELCDILIKLFYFIDKLI